MVSVTPLRTYLADVCFCHWPVERAALERLVPEWLTVETVDGDAWLSAIGHTVERVAAFGVDVTRPAQAVNVRTYVRGPQENRGVFFLAIYTTDAFTRSTAPRVLGLPYERGHLERRIDSSGTVHRTLTVGREQRFDLRYDPRDVAPSTVPPDSLSAFLVERDRFFVEGSLGIPLGGSVGHDPWQLAPIDATVTGSLLGDLGLDAAAGDPLFHFSRGIEIDIAPPTPLVNVSPGKYSD